MSPSVEKLLHIITDVVFISDSANHYIIYLSSHGSQTFEIQQHSSCKVMSLTSSILWIRYIILLLVCAIHVFCMWHLWHKMYLAMYWH